MPLLSQSASGGFGKRLVYNLRNNNTSVGAYHRPLRSPSAKQVTQRYFIGLLNARWFSFSASEKTAYDVLALAYNIKNKTNLTGYNYFIKLANSDPVSYYGLFGLWCFNDPSLSVVPNFGSVVCPFTLSGGSLSPLAHYIKSDCKGFGFCVQNSESNFVITSNLQNSSQFSDGVSISCDFVLNTNDSHSHTLVDGVGFFILYHETNNKITLYTTLDGGYLYIDFPANNYIVNKLYHLTTTWSKNGDGYDVKMYLDKTLVTSGHCIGALRDAENLFRLLNNASLNKGFLGNVDNFCVIKRVLGVSEIGKICDIMRLGKKRSAF